jgi:rod shape determining protein RodA
MSIVKKSLFNRVDGITFMLYCALVFIGIIAVFSVEYRSTDPSIFMSSKSHMKQLLWLGISLFVGMTIIFTESKFFSSVAFLSYAICLLLLILTIFIGVNMKGSHSWLSIAGVKFQPGEVGKIFTSLALARYLSLSEVNFKRTKDRLIGLSIALVPAFIIILQNETGLALVYFSFILVMYREGLPNAILIAVFSLGFLTVSTLLLSHLTMFILITLITVLIAVLARFTLKRDATARIVLIGSFVFSILFSQVVIPFAFKHVMKGYQIERIYIMLGQDVPAEYVKANDNNPDAKKKDTGYNVRQSKIAIGSGGLFGKGYLNGTSTKNSFVPEQNTDFIFCSIGEQFGFLGSLVVIALYISLILRIIFLAERQKSDFSRIYGYCVASVLFFHFAINVSMTIGLAPVIGITLPFLSYGGTSLLSFSILVFILLRLDTDRHLMIH